MWILWIVAAVILDCLGGYIGLFHRLYRSAAAAILDCFGVYIGVLQRLYWIVAAAIHKDQIL